jgi:hypothetical protein
MLGSDTLRRSAAKTMRDPFTGKQVALLPALFLDCAVIHVQRADPLGNCQIDGIAGFAPEMAAAAKRLIVTAEEIIPTERVRERPDRTIIPFYQVDAVVHAPFGAHPGECAGLYRRDDAAFEEFLEAARTPRGIRAHLAETALAVKDHAGYLALFGRERLDALRIRP